MSPRTTTITGIGAALPGVADPVELLDDTPARTAPEVDPAARLGTRGLRYKDRATQLALCAARDALHDAALLDGDDLTVPGESVAVVVSSNLGNLDTVCSVVSTIATQGAAGTSPMALPNASSNVIAASVAIRFGLRGPNVTVCNGATSGLDAMWWGAMLVAAGRVDRAVVVGVETRNAVVHQLVGGDPDDLLDGAVALVLEHAARDRGRVLPIQATVGRHARVAGLPACLSTLADAVAPAPGIWFVSERYRGGAPYPWLAGVPQRDLTEVFGRASGALGVLQCAAAAQWLRAGAMTPALITSGGEDDDAVSGLVLQPWGGAS